MIKKIESKKTACVACLGKTTFFCKLPAKADLTNTLKKNQFVNYVHCLTCNTIQQDPLPSARKLMDAVKSEYAHTKKKQQFEINVSDNAKQQHHAIVNKLLEYGIDKKVLEIGTGIGNLCSILLKSGIACEGIDASPQIVSLAQKRRLPIHKGNFKEIKKQNYYSAILMSHVFEHLSDPEETLLKINNLLHKSGYFFSAQPTASMTLLLNRLLKLNRTSNKILPNIAYLNLNPWHIVIFSIQGMRLLAKRCNFKLIEVIPMPSVKSEGIVGAIRSFYNIFNSFGEKLMPNKWPFHVAHLFIMQKK